VIIILVLADCVLPATLVAVTVTTFGESTRDGAR